MILRLPSLLDRYTGGVREHEVPGATVAEGLVALEARFPGIRFRVVDEQDRIRPHIKVYVGQAPIRDLNHPVAAEAVQIVGALSGG